jgi:hypothetical protein
MKKIFDLIETPGTLLVSKLNNSLALTISFENKVQFQIEIKKFEAKIERQSITAQQRIEQYRFYSPEYFDIIDQYTNAKMR